ncbi:hypothetical protein SAMN05216266_1138 [Amycolatopsis marina]|uniref:Uncharacterized protein n=1 Tax=Amycolatopsis marina TaxID=490629 RepID=A0A1I1BFB3_9PSEU|nr:hypothetical protein [Amycolatopsis marina]SFB47438.1 hypothetical protein SAMN05216266_1138 [Amycolatopsis marina]
MGQLRGPRRRFPAGRSILLAGVLLAVVAGGFYLARPDETKHSPDAAAGLPVTWELDPERPFAGTPAQDWPDGAAGIVPPEPAAVGDHTAAEVAAALADVRDLLVISRLERSVIEGGDVEPYLSMLAPAEREARRAEFSGEGDNGPGTLATRIDPAFRLLPAEPKVSGRMWAEEGADGALTIRTNYVFAYAFDPGAQTRLRSPLDAVAMVRADVDYDVRTGSRWYERDRGIAFGGGQIGVYSMACEPTRRGLLAPAYSESEFTGLPDDRGPGEYFDHARPMEFGNSCA